MIVTQIGEWICWWP